jgi:three-Cys-motif partner protein
MINPKEFFKEMSENSRVKKEIVSKYFGAWATLIAPKARKFNQNAFYIDLFAGPGIYENGEKSTPIEILEKIINNKNFNNVGVILNDSDKYVFNNLKEAVKNLNGINSLSPQPVITNEVVTSKLKNNLKNSSISYLFTFLDPFGYKGLNLEVIDLFLKGWGSDCIFFFSYNGINRAFNNNELEETAKDFLGEELYKKLNNGVKNLSPIERELYVIEEITNYLKKGYAEYVLPFRFKQEEKNKTSHHLIFASKNVLGYSIMKDIMSRQSSSKELNSVSFEYNHADKKYPTLFKLDQSVNDLKTKLPDVFKGKTLTTKEIYQNHNIGTPFVFKDYQTVLKDLLANKQIQAKKPDGKAIRPNTFPENVIVTFP